MQAIRREIPPMLQLALPLILAELGWMSMGIVDTVMVGHMASPVLGIAAAGLGQVLYNTLAFGIAGILLGLATCRNRMARAASMTRTGGCITG